MARTLSFLVFLSIALLVLGGMHAYIWARLVRDTGLPEPWRRIATVLLVVAAVTIPAALLVSRLRGTPLTRVVPWIAFVWLGVAFLLLSALLAIDLFRLVASTALQLREWLWPADAPPADPARRQFVARAVAGTTLAVVATAAGAAIRSAEGPAEIVEVPVRVPRLPRALDGLSIVHITDLHVGPTIRRREVDRVVAQANALRPDVVAITGDLVDGTVPELGAIVAGLARLRARYGVHFVTGNHEYFSGVDEWLRFLPGLGIRVLRNERVSIGDAGASLDLAGVDDWHAGRYGNGHGYDLGKALAGRDPERALVLLAHQPLGVEPGIREGVGLQLSGHTHGGQIFPFNLAVHAAFRYVRGLYPVAGGAGHVYVSKGTGYWGPPMRLGSPAEIARITLLAG
ncbi:MAG TPA: metallophosphoesterase [Anaeromyxobacteraceae bacterium]|nr:metallophosphoesterase [Anaeromyxobacteraceae bacterium]